MQLGLFYKETGISRSFISNAWLPNPASSWGQTQVSGIDIKHADCNGDGTIDDNDTLAIISNYNKIHTYNLKLTDVDQVQSLYNLSYDFIPHLPYVVGDTVKANINLGSNTSVNPAIYGISYTSVIPEGSITLGTLKLSIDSNMLGNSSSQILRHHEVFEKNGKCDFVIVRKNHTDTSGYGRVGHLQFVYNGKGVLNNPILSFKNIKAVNHLGQPLSIGGTPSGISSNTISAINISKLSLEEFSIFPNPVNEYLIINSFGIHNINSIELLNITGQVIHNYEFSFFNLSKMKLPISKLITNGMYFIKIRTDFKISQFKIIVQRNE